MNDKSVDGDPVGTLAESFIERYRSGERPSLTEYCENYPELAGRIRELFPALVMMEELAPDVEGSMESSEASLGSLPRSPRGERVERLGDYRIVREIGRGGMGVVYEAVQLSLGRHVALKVLPIHAAKDAKALGRFRREARAAARLHHTNIVPVFEVGQDHDVCFYAMQFIQGQGLDEVLTELQRMRKSKESSCATCRSSAEQQIAASLSSAETPAAGAASSLLTGQFQMPSSLVEGGRELGPSADPVFQLKRGERARSPIATDSGQGISETNERPSLGPGLESGEVNDGAAPSSSAILASRADLSSVSESNPQHFYRSVARIGVDVAEALEYAHGRGVVHRDIKPSNLLLDAAGTVWVTDFGLAKSEGDDLTHTGDLVGTLRYMAPERFRGHSDTRSDVYGLGVTLYELLTLKPAFDSHDRVRLIQQVTQVSAARPRKLDPRIPRDIETIVLKAIDKDPCARYASAGELAEDLRRYLADRPIRARRSAVWERGWRWCRRNPVVAVLLSTVAALLVAAIVILAEGNARIRSEVAAKDAAITTAHQAVEHMLTRVANNKLSDVPLAHPLRESLLKDAVAFYEGFVSQGVAGVSIRENMATTLHELGAIQRDLARYDDARQSFERTIDLRRGLVAMNPLSPGAREKLADAQAALAFTVWQIRTGPAGASDREAESRFLEAVETYSSLERDWPDRRQPIGQCLRQLARLASQRGEKSRTEQLLREAIAKEEAFLEQHPDRTNSRIDLCWAYAQLDEEVLKNSPTRLVEAEQVLKTGLRNVELVLDENSRSKSARDVAAYLQIALGRCYSKMNRIEDAVHLFEAAADQIGSLCAEFPWNEEYWRNACFFHRESVKCLQQTGQADEAQRFVRHVARWFREAAPQVPNDPGPQAGVRRCAESLIALLRTTGQHDEADHLAKFAPSHEPK